MASDEQQWVVRPDEVRIEIAIGREAKLSPEVKEALDRLAHVLEQEQDVQGYMEEEEEELQTFTVNFNCMGVW